MNNASPKRSDDLVPGQSSFADERTERTRCGFSMPGHGPSAARKTPGDDVSGAFMAHPSSPPADCHDRVRGGTNGRTPHPQTATISSQLASEIGAPRFRRLTSHPRMASGMQAMASSRIPPCGTRPGNAAHSATKTSSPPGSMVTSNTLRPAPIATAGVIRRHLAPSRPGLVQP